MTKKIAQYLAEKLSADIEEIVDKQDRNGAMGYILAGRDVLQKKLTEIEPTKKNPADYDLVIIGTPVWVGTMAVAVRTYLEKYKSSINQLAIFTAQGGSQEQKVFQEIETLLKKKAQAKVWIRTKEVVKDQFQDKVADFISQMK